MNSDQANRKLPSNQYSQPSNANSINAGSGYFELLSTVAQNYKTTLENKKVQFQQQEAELIKPIHQLAEQQREIDSNIRLLQNQHKFLKDYYYKRSQITKEAYTTGLKHLIQKLLRQLNAEQPVFQNILEQSALSYPFIDCLSQPTLVKPVLDKTRKDLLQQRSAMKTMMPLTQQFPEAQQKELKNLLLTQEAFLNYHYEFLMICQRFLGTNKEAYELDRSQTIDTLVQDFSNLIEQPDSVFEINKTSDLSKAEKEKKIASYRELLNKKAEAYAYHHLPLQQGDETIKAKLEEIEQEIAALVTTYDELKQAKTLLLNKYLLEKERNELTLHALKEQSDALTQKIALNPHPIEAACIAGDLILLKQYITAGKKDPASLEKQVQQALHLACRYGHVTLASYLLSQIKVNPNVSDGYYYPVHYAAMSAKGAESIELLKLLQAHGANLLQQAGINRYFRTALHSACFCGDNGTVEWLIQQAPELVNRIEGKDYSSIEQRKSLHTNTPLHNAAYYGHAGHCEILLAAKANPKERNKDEHTPLMEAFINRKLTLKEKLKVINVFRRHGIWLSREDLKALSSHMDYQNLILPVLKEIIGTVPSFDEQESFHEQESPNLASSPIAVAPAMSISANWVIPRSQFKVGDFIAAGTYGVVCNGEWQKVRVAIKKFHGQDMTPLEWKLFENEAAAMANLSHPNVIRLHGICVDPGECSLIMPYYPKSLYTALRFDKDKPTWPERWNIAIGVAKGLGYLHSNGIYHRDLKAANVLLTDRNEPVLTDFGLAQVKKEEQSHLSAQLATKMVGSLRWLPPELLDKPDQCEYSVKTDIYSFGMLLWEIAAAQTPYNGYSEEAVKEKIRKNEHEQIPKGTPPSYAALITKCWDKRQQARPTIDEIIETLEKNTNEALKIS